jgi:hypothetical protein
MQKFIPIFPLNLVAYPGEKLNLHIFEPRYIQLIKECNTEGKTFGIPVVNNKELLEYGTEMKLEKVQKVYDTGEMDIEVVGLQVFRVLEVIDEVPDKLYSGAIISLIHNIEDAHYKLSQELELFATELFDLLDIKENIFKPGFTFTSFKLAHYVGFDFISEYELLRHPHETARQKIIVEHIKKILPAVKQIAEIKIKAKLNGHYRMINPPEGF